MGTSTVPIVACMSSGASAKNRGGSPGGRSETTGIGFVEEVGFKPGVKERAGEL